MTLTPEDVAKLREKATLGPWMIWLGQIGTEDECVVEVDDIDGDANAAFIAAVHDMADLIAEQAREIAELRAQVRLLRWATEPVRAAWGQK